MTQELSSLMDGELAGPDVQPYLNAHRQLPAPEQYRPTANNRAAASATR